MAGVQFPANKKGERSTTSFNKAVYGAMAGALESKDIRRRFHGKTSCAGAGRQDWGREGLATQAAQALKDFKRKLLNSRFKIACSARWGIASTWTRLSRRLWSSRNGLELEFGSPKDVAKLQEVLSKGLDKVGSVQNNSNEFKGIQMKACLWIFFECLKRSLQNIGLSTQIFELRHVAWTSPTATVPPSPCYKPVQQLHGTCGKRKSLWNFFWVFWVFSNI